MIENAKVMVEVGGELKEVGVKIYMNADNGGEVTDSMIVQAFKTIIDSRGWDIEIINKYMLKRLATERTVHPSDMEALRVNYGIDLQFPEDEYSIQKAKEQKEKRGKKREGKKAKKNKKRIENSVKAGEKNEKPPITDEKTEETAKEGEVGETN